FAYGYLATALGLYLDQLGLTPTEIGIVFTAAIAGSALMTVFWSILADRYGRRRTVATMALLMAVGGIVFALTNSFVGLILANFVIFITLSDGVELARVGGERRFIGVHRSAGTVAKLSALFGIDAFAGGLVVQSIVAYWFFLRWGMQISELAVVFFWVGILSGLSLLAAGWLAERIGLLNTMVFTHLPSNILLLLVPLAPSASL